MTSMKRISKACCYICTALNPEPVGTPLYTDLFSEKKGQTSKVSMFDFFFQVQNWLDSLYAGKPVPNFEKNERTIDLLYQLMITNLARDHDTQLIVQDYHQKAAEYSAEGVFLPIDFLLMFNLFN